MALAEMESLLYASHFALFSGLGDHFTIRKRCSEKLDHLFKDI